MSKKNGRGRRDRGDAGTPAAGPDGGGAPAQQRRKLTVPERMVAKSRAIKDMVGDLYKMASFYGAPDPITETTSNLMVDVDTWCGMIKEKVDGGWQPAAKAEMKELAEGDKIAIDDASVSLYSFIPEGVKLAVRQIERSANNRIRRVLLCDERVFGEGLPEGALPAFGWAPLAHLKRR